MQIPAILGRKLGMTQAFVDGKRLPVTVIEAGPCHVTQVKTVEKRLVRKPEKGHAEKAGVAAKRHHREVRYPGDTAPDVELGQEIKVDVFEGVKRLDVVGTSKGKGFAGVMKRWNFGGGRASHGSSKHHRVPGGIGRAGSISKGVFKGKKMPGHLGSERITARCRLVKIDAEKNLLLVKGAVPGAAGGLLFVRRSKREYGPIEKPEAAESQTEE
ncbi:MAG: 50S ribosomal protein L3 [Planctomycetota bacterium]